MVVLASHVSEGHMCLQLWLLWGWCPGLVRVCEGPCVPPGHWVTQAVRGSFVSRHALGYVLGGPDLTGRERKVGLLVEAVSSHYCPRS